MSVGRLNGPPPRVTFFQATAVKSSPGTPVFERWPATPIVAHQLAVVGEQHELAVMFIGEPNVVMLIDPDGVRKAEQSGTPGTFEVSVAIEDHHRMFVGAIETKHPIARIDRDRGGLHVDARRHPSPVFVDVVGVFAAADDGSPSRPSWGSFARSRSWFDGILGVTSGAGTGIPVSPPLYLQVCAGTAARVKPAPCWRRVGKCPLFVPLG